MNLAKSGKLLIHTRADFVWQNGLEYALQGVFLAHKNGIDLHYLLEGDGPSLESLAFTHHDLGMDDICTLKILKNANRTRVQAHICLLPVLKPGYLNPLPWKNYLSVIATDRVTLPAQEMFPLGIVRVDPWDTGSIADAIRAIQERMVSFGN